MLLDHFDCRPLTAADLRAVAAVDASATPWCWSLAQFAQSHSAGHLCHVCEWQQAETVRVLGFAIVQRVLDEASLLNIAVDPGWQGQGLGRRLLMEVMDICRAEGVKRMLLEVRASNLRAQQLYESLGFSQDGRRRGYYPGKEEREDALLFSLQLQD